MTAVVVQRRGHRETPPPPAAPPPEQGSQVEVTFTPEGPHTTRVDLTHRHLERYGPQAERMRRILDGKGGEPLAAYARHFETKA